MSDLVCAIVENGVVTNTVVCCGGNPAACWLKPTRVPASAATVSPGYTMSPDGTFAPPPQTVLAAAAQVAGTAAASVSVTK